MINEADPSKEIVLGDGYSDMPKRKEIELGDDCSDMPKHIDAVPMKELTVGLYRGYLIKTSPKCARMCSVTTQRLAAIAESPDESLTLINLVQGDPALTSHRPEAFYIPYDVPPVPPRRPNL